MDLSRIESGGGNERTTEIAILGTEGTEDSFPELQVPPHADQTLDTEDVLATGVLDCEARINRAENELRDLLKLLEDAISESEGCPKRVQMLKDMQTEVMSAVECFPPAPAQSDGPGQTQAATLKAWSDSDPEQCALNIPALRIPILIAPRVLSLLEPFLDTLEQAVKIDAARIQAGQPVTLLQKMHLSVKKAVVLLRIN